MKTRKTWAIPIAALAFAMLFAYGLVATGTAQAQTAVSALTVVLNPAASTGDNVVIYKVEGYTDPGAAPTTGQSRIDATVNVRAISEIGPDGNAVTTPRAPFEATFTAGTGSTGVAQFDRITVVTATTPAPVPGSTYVVDLTATYDKDVTKAAADNPNTPHIREDGAAISTPPALPDTSVANDDDGQIVTRLTVYIPYVPTTSLTFQVDDSKVVEGEVISSVGRDRVNNPLAFELKTLGPAEATVAATGAGVDEVDFELDTATGKITVSAAKSRLAAGDDRVGTITITHDDIDLDDDEETFTIALDVDIANVDSLVFSDDAAAAAAGTAQAARTDAMPYHYEVTIPENTPKGTGILPYFVGNAASEVAGNQGIPEEKISGVIGGASANLFRVNNETMAIEYAGETGALVGGVEHILRLTASGDTGLASRQIVGMARITVADVDEAPTTPEEIPVTLLENEDGAGLVADKTVVHDFAGVGTDPEGRTLEYTTTASGFDFDGTKLIVAGAIGDITREDNPATLDVTETDWPTGAPGAWDFAVTPVTGLYPDLKQTITVTASDSVTSNNQQISVPITLDVNEPVAAVTAADDLPAGVTLANGIYTVAKSVRSRDIGVPVVDLSQLVITDSTNDDMDYGDVLSLAAVGSPSNNEQPFVINSGTGQVTLSYVPNNNNEWTFEVAVEDGYNEQNNTQVLGANNLPVTPVEYQRDLTLFIKVVLTVEQPPQPIAGLVNIVVDENTTVCNVRSADGTLGDCTVAGEVPNAASYSVENSSDNGPDSDNPNYEVDPTTGAITVNVAPNFEDGESPFLQVVANNAEGDRVGSIAVRVTINDVNEAPDFNQGSDEPSVSTADVFETAQVGDKLVVTDSSPAVDLTPVTATDQDAGDTITYSIPAGSQFAVNASTAELTVASVPLQAEGALPIDIVVTATDAAGLTDTHTVTVTIVDENEAPVFTSPTEADTETTIPENMVYDASAAGVIFTFTAQDPDGDVLLAGFSVRESADGALFTVENTKAAATGGYSAELKVKQGVALDYDTPDYNRDSGYRVEVEVQDPEGLAAVLLLTVKLQDLNDEPTVFVGTPPSSLQVQENTSRGVALGTYTATDADGVGTVTYSLTGTHADQFSISDTGQLMTLASLDFDNNVPCGTAGCSLTVVADDGEPTTAAASQAVTITVTSADDSISTLAVSKANPVPGESQGDANTALADVKTTAANQTKVQERPSDLPATGDGTQTAPAKFVKTEWANWGTVLRIEVTAQSPDANCDGGNRCVVVKVEGDSSDDILQLKAYRSSTQENLFVAAVMPVSGEGNMVETVVGKNSTGAENPPIYKHTEQPNTPCLLYTSPSPRD